MSCVAAWRKADYLLLVVWLPVQDGKGLTPLILACIYDHSECAEYLMQMGANPFIMVGHMALQHVQWIRSCAYLHNGCCSRRTCNH